MMASLLPPLRLPSFCPICLEDPNFLPSSPAELLILQDFPPGSPLEFSPATVSQTDVPSSVKIAVHVSAGYSIVTSGLWGTNCVLFSSLPAPRAGTVKWMCQGGGGGGKMRSAPTQECCLVFLVSQTRTWIDHPLDLGCDKSYLKTKTSRQTSIYSDFWLITSIYSTYIAESCGFL